MAETATSQKWPRDLLSNPCGTAIASSPDQMTMIKLTDAQRAVLTQAFPAVAHPALGALVFGQFLREQPYSLRLAVTGVGIWLWFVGMALVFAGGKRWTSR
jgi:hypothetical protein